MRASLIVIVLSCLCGFAAEYPAFTSGMKTAAKTMEFLSKAGKKTGEPVSGAAERMASVYEEMIPFWRLREDKEAVQWAQEGKAAATRMASAAFGGDEAKAAAAFQSLSATCKTCHAARRDRTPEGKYIFKKLEQ